MSQLSDRAMTVRLITRKPTTRVRLDQNVEAAVKSFVGDDGVRINSVLFAERINPIRQLLNEAAAVYAFHKANTVPYIDRGPRLLPVTHYQTYRDEMRRLVGDVDALRQRLTEYDYNRHVQQDVDARNYSARAQGKLGNATLSDYPAYASFMAGLSLQFTFAPLPDARHPVFDTVAEEDKAALEQQLAETADAVRAELIGRIADPLKKLVDKLAISAGEPGSIFRDTLVHNLTDAIAQARLLAMGDPTVLAACDHVEAGLSGHARNPQVLRESPIVRSEAAIRMADVQKKMSWMFGATP